MDMMEESRKKFGARVERQRKRIDMTMDELADLMGYKHRSSIDKLEKGENSIPQDKIGLLAVALKTSVAYLMGWEDEMMVTEEERNLLACYRNADEDAKTIVRAALRRFDAETGWKP